MPTPAENLIYGIHSVAERLRHDRSSVRVVWISHRAQRRLAKTLDAARVRYELADDARLDRLVGGAVHQGVVAEVLAFRYAEWDSVLEGSADRLLALDRVTDSHNLGAIIRTADAAGVGGVILPKHESAGVTGVVEKTASGATASVPICRVTNLARSLEQAREAGFTTIGLDAEAPSSLYATTLPDRGVLVGGSEDKGLRRLVQRACDVTVSLPMRGNVASLNVSVAVGIALYEWGRQVDERARIR